MSFECDGHGYSSIKPYLTKLPPSELLDKLKILSWAFDDRQALLLPEVATSHGVRAVAHQALDVHDVSDVEMWQGRMRRRGGADTPHWGRAVKNWLRREVDNQRGILVKIR